MRQPQSGSRRAACVVAAVLSGVAGEAVAAELSGHVTDVAGIKSLQGAEVEIIELGRRTETTADGGFRFSGVAPGRYRLRSRYVGAEPIEVSIDVAEDGNAPLDIRIGNDTMTELLVVGQRASQASALSRQRSADSVESVLTRDAIGQFPDQNVAESLRRLPGISIQNDQGEGRFVVLRGLDPKLNAVNVNGARVPSPEADSRALALDTVPSDLIESIEVKKSLTPDMDGDTIGGSIDIKTAGAFDRKKGFLGATAEGSYNEQTDRWSPKGSVDFSQIFAGGKLGVAGGFSYYDRRFGSEGIEASDWAEEDGVPYAEELDYRDYQVTRKRVGGSLSLDYKATPGTTLYARSLLTSFEDQEHRSRVMYGFDEAPSGGDATHAEFLSDDGEIKIEREMKERKETQDVYSLVFGGDSYLGPWTLNYSGSTSRATEKEPNRLDTNFERSFEDEGELGVTVNTSRLFRPVISFSDEALVLDPAEYELDKFEVTNGSARDREWSARFDVARDFALASGSAQLKFGGKLRDRRKSYDLQLDVYEYDGDETPTLEGLAGNVKYGLGHVNPTVSPGSVREWFAANTSSLELQEADSFYESNVADFRVDENIAAGYAMGRYDVNDLRVIAGVRVERTQNDLFGSTVIEGEDTLTPASFERRYTDWLPSLNLRYEAAPDLILRGAAYRSLARPNISDLAPRFVVSEDNEGELGNPDLKPYRAWSFDASAEWYFGRNAVAQAGVFHKSIKDFIFTLGYEDFTYSGFTFDAATQATNGGTAKVNGLELSYQQALDFLPAPFDGLLAGANATFVDTEAHYAQAGSERDIALPGTSKQVYNFTLGYEKNGLSLRAALVRRSGYLDEVSADGDADRYIRPHTQLDLSAKYRVTPRLQLYAEAVNVNDAAFRAVLRGTDAGGDRLSQYEEYSWTAKLGLRLSFRE